MLEKAQTRERYLHPGDMTPEKRLDALAEVLADGFLYLAENGLLEDVVGEAADSGRKESVQTGAGLPCFPPKDRLSFHPDGEGARSE